MLAQGGLGLPNLAALSFAGFVPGQSITLGIYNNVQTFYAPVLAFEAAQSITPALFDEGDQFYVASIIADALPGQILVQHFDEGDLFYAPVFVIQPATAINVAYFNEGDQFYAPAIAGDATIQDVLPLRFVSVNQFLQPQIVVSDKEPVYNYPIGRGLYSDYGMRAAMTFYKRRMIIGRR